MKLFFSLFSLFSSLWPFLPPLHASEPYEIIEEGLVINTGVVPNPDAESLRAEDFRDTVNEAPDKERKDYEKFVALYLKFLQKHPKTGENTIPDAENLFLLYQHLKNYLASLQKPAADLEKIRALVHDNQEPYARSTALAGVEAWAGLGFGGKVGIFLGADEIRGFRAGPCISFNGSFNCGLGAGVCISGQREERTHDEMLSIHPGSCEFSGGALGLGGHRWHSQTRDKTLAISSAGPMIGIGYYNNDTTATVRIPLFPKFRCFSSRGRLFAKLEKIEKKLEDALRILDFTAVRALLPDYQSGVQNLVQDMKLDLPSYHPTTLHVFSSIPSLYCNHLNNFTPAK